ncbi:hypothetical protein [Halohasta salina]|uniref:hypothetical protein n=1 Tax=Halohasta salina TaxID=2961621 RepID=UPI0020A3A814|nr:hypothetical protein [Halohasta salina]
MSDKRSEACGRCSMSTVVETVAEEETDRDPLGDERIELEAAEIRRVAPAAWVGRLTSRLDEIVHRLTYGR